MLMFTPLQIRCLKVERNMSKIINEIKIVMLKHGFIPCTKSTQIDFKCIIQSPFYLNYRTVNLLHVF